MTRNRIKFAVVFASLIAAMGMTNLAFAELTQSESTAMLQAKTIPSNIKEVASDMNKDGKPDRWESYDKGILTGVKADTNDDGKIDEWAVVQGNKIVKVEKDADYDGKVDKWISY